MFSRRTDHPRVPNQVAAAIADAASRGAVRFDLTISNPTAVGLTLDAESIRSAWHDAPVDRYRPDPRGSLGTRTCVGREIGIAPDRIVLTASTSEAYAFAFATLADPGDRILVPTPSYPLLEWLATVSGVSLVPYELRYDGRWYIDFGSVDAAIDSTTRAIVCVSPNNPTGSFLSRDERDSLLARDLPLIVDEVFSRYPLDAELRDDLPPATSGLVMRLSGLSKLAALPQMKLGWIGLEGDSSLVEEARARLELLGDTFLSVATPTDLAACAWLEASRAVRARIVARCRSNLATLDAKLVGTALSRLHAEAGWTAILRVPSVRSEDEIVIGLLDHGVVVQPGWFYDLGGGAHLVVSLLVDEETFGRGVDEIVRFFAERIGSGTDQSR